MHIIRANTISQFLEKKLAEVLDIKGKAPEGQNCGKQPSDRASKLVYLLTISYHQLKAVGESYTTSRKY
jgi:hypothetical protein